MQRPTPRPCAFSTLLKLCTLLSLLLSSALSCAEAPTRLDQGVGGDGGVDGGEPSGPPSGVLPFEARFELPSAREFIPSGAAIFSEPCPEDASATRERLILSQWPLSCEGPLESIADSRSWRALVADLQADCVPGGPQASLIEHSYQELGEGESVSTTESLESHPTRLDSDESVEGQRLVRVSLQPEFGGGADFELGFVEATLYDCGLRPPRDERAWWLGPEPEE